MIYTTVARVQAALGPSVAFATDPVAADVVDAANALVTRKREANRYVDVDPDVDPAYADVVHGATLYAVALWRERQSAETFVSFDELDGNVTVGGSWGQIKRLLGIPRGHVDTPMSIADAYKRRRDILYPPRTVTP